ncbi:MAG TPA: nicotinate-nucleotide adenylyltransferase [Pyrinomonadaceae bacterium]|nr:nicotinate-nucleotide adenylyltransferase [Pyrinomonadaceae bacterium]
MGEKPARSVALYGGSFDPVHEGHLSVARKLSELFALDEVLFIPAHVAPHKRGRRVTAALHRHAMLALATQTEPRFRVSTVELDAPERPYTVETLARFVETRGRAARLFFVMGADSWAEIKTWREWERVLSLTDHIVVTRPGYELTTAHVTDEVRARVVDVRGADAERVGRELEGEGAKIFLSDAVELDISATGIRRLVEESGAGAQLARLVPAAVADYIRKYELYRGVHERELTDDGDEEEGGREEARG